MQPGTATRRHDTPGRCSSRLLAYLGPDAAGDPPEGSGQGLASVIVTESEAPGGGGPPYAAVRVRSYVDPLGANAESPVAVRVIVKISSYVAPGSTEANGANVKPRTAD